jgi:hypothetical protein
VWIPKGRAIAIQIGQEIPDRRSRVTTWGMPTSTWHNTVLGGTTTAVIGTTQIMGAATNTNVAPATEALGAVGSVPGLVTAAASGGNLNAAQVATTLSGAASLATAPQEAVKNPATAADAVQTVRDTGGLVQRTATAVQNFVNPGPPPAPKPPSPPGCSVAGACPK